MIARTVAAALLVAVVASPSTAQQGGITVEEAARFPAEVQIIPAEPDASAVQHVWPRTTDPRSADEEFDDVILHWDQFSEAGYHRVEWLNDGKESPDVFRELVSPEYVKRTGKGAPVDGRFEYAFARLTESGFNDVIVISRLPGDCNEDGCRVSVHRTEDGTAWTTVGSFRAMSVGVREGQRELLPARIASVGDDVTQSFTLTWDGKRFVEDD